MNIYKEILKNNIPKLLTLFNLDNFSLTYGYGDRSFWGWKISDFVNGTMQGGIHSLAIALKLDLIKNENFVLEVIDSVIKAIEKIRGKNGSLAEAYPNENSFCVSALVAFDILSAIKHLDSRISQNQREAYLNLIEPLVGFITKNGEKHAVISNHLATAAAAFILWSRLTGSSNQKYKQILELIYKNQSQEGWYREYEGADPGYQTLSVYYLSLVYEETKDEELKRSLIKSTDFLKFFIHPDKTIGGVYGARNTEVYYPGGIVCLSGIFDSCAVLAGKLQEGIINGYHIYPENIDAGNFIPLINSYSIAALYYEQNKKYIEDIQGNLPYQGIFEKDFSHAGIFIKSTEEYYAIVNYKKGGAIKVFDKLTEKIDIEDGGLFGELKNGVKFSTQQIDETITFEDYRIKSRFYKINKTYPTPLYFIVLRLLSLVTFKSIYFSNCIKKIIVKMLITNKRKLDGEVARIFKFLEEKIVIQEVIKEPRGCKRIGHFGKCKAIYMASSGYYHKQLKDLPQEAKLVEFIYEKSNFNYRR